MGQGDCAVFQTAGTVVLIDAGPKSPTFDAGKRIVFPELDRIGANSVDLIFLSHPDQDHVGGTGALHKAFPKARVVMSDQFKGNPLMEQHLKGWNMSDADVIWLGPSAHVKVGAFSLSIADPPFHARAGDNEGSMFVHLVGPAGSAVFSGDADAMTEKKMEPLDDWSAQVMKVGHHGSKSSTTASWLKEVHPQYAVISCGLNNMYGHPAAQTTTRLSKAGVTTFRTDLQGSIRFDYNDEKGFTPVTEFRSRL